MSAISDGRVAFVKACQTDSSAAAVPPDERQLCRLLDKVHEGLVSRTADADRIYRVVDILIHGLAEIRRSVSRAQWLEMLSVGRAHPICDLVHQDPFTARAFQKPRGYAGDAVMMDYIYGREEGWAKPPASELGAAIFDYTTAAPASAGVRERRCYIAELFERIGREQPGAHVLSIAAGHLREASLSSALRRGRFGRFVAMDADAASLEEIQLAYARFGVEPVVADVRRMLAGRLNLGSFDLIYTTGLYDYLTDSLAKRLTANLFASLNPGGRLVIANFLPEIGGIGYMEMYMDWHLIYRSRREMVALADKITPSRIEEIRIAAERNENVVILEITKR